jgi:hypothetical protein
MNIALQTPHPSTPEHRLPKEFEALLQILPGAPDLGAWSRDYSRPACSAWICAALEACDLPEGRSLLPTEVPLAFRGDVVVSYLGECAGDEEDGGCSFHALLFTVAKRLEVVAWIEADGPWAHLIFRGERGLMEDIALELAMFENDCFPGPATSPEPPPIVVFLRSRQ